MNCPCCTVYGPGPNNYGRDPDRVVVERLTRELLNAVAQRKESPVSVRAKFKCISITEREGWGGVKIMRDVKMSPVTGGSDENKKFFASTPSGELTVGCTNVEATQQFEVGKEYYVDFTPAEAPVAAQG